MPEIFLGLKNILIIKQKKGKNWRGKSEEEEGRETNANVSCWNFINTSVHYASASYVPVAIRAVGITTPAPSLPGAPKPF